MDNFQFSCEQVTNASPSFGTFLFNRKQHLFLQTKNGWWCYKIKNHSQQIGFIYFNIKKTKASSPLKATFGSFEMNERVTSKEFEKWVDFILDDLKTKGVNEVMIKHYPSTYQQVLTTKLKTLLAKKKFERSEEVASIVNVDKNIFEDKIVISKKQKLRKSSGQFRFGQDQLSLLKRNYQFILTTRRKKGFSLSMSYSDLQKAVRNFPDDFLLFSVHDADILIATCICVKVSKDVLYTFYYAHDSGYDKVSPVVMLLNGIYGYAQKNAIKKLDLGTSQLGAKINMPLLHFKESVGGKPSAKYTFTKNW